MKRSRTDFRLILGYRELHQKFHNSDPSLSETTIDAADEHQLKLDALVKGFHGGLCLPSKTARPASPSISETVAITNSFSNLEEDKNQEVEEEAKLAVVPKPRPPQPIHLKIKENFRAQMRISSPKFSGNY
ncbi:hypothetical protein TNCV_1363201 [Trichonephila clavipes]|nr:hypothetical protein TNCV_1363201 [Trichonephila clavipes]